jgi:septation ring formation regulator EzrA
MGLSLYFYKKGVNLQEISDKIDELNKKKRAIDDEIEHLEDAYNDAKLDSLNITHNLTTMAEAVGLYKVLWHPAEIGITSASQMIPYLEKGLQKLESNPEKYKAFNSSNGYGTYEKLVIFCRSALYRCRECPDAIIYANV